MELEAKDAGHVLLWRPLWPDRRIGHEQQVGERCSKEGPVHVPLIHINQYVRKGSIMPPVLMTNSKRTTA